MQTIPLDAIPDLSDTQVIVYSRWDRSPDIIEDQVTYPIVTAMLGAPRVKDVRGFSDFGYSYVYIIFDEGTDIYWARSRTLEYLSKIQSRLPQGVKTELGPDATGVGWVFQYALVDRPPAHNLAELRSYQDWFLRYQLQAVPGVAEVAPLGGFVRQYQVNVDPDRLAAYDIPIAKWSRPCAAATTTSAAAWWSSAAANTWCAAAAMPAPQGPGEHRAGREPGRHSGARKDIGTVTLGPDMRRGVADLDGTGRGGLGHRGHAPGRERAGRHRARQGQAEGDRAGPAHRASRS